MTCKIPQERFVLVVDETASTYSPTVPYVTIPNRNGSECIALGSSDQTGIVRLQPRISQETSLRPLYVSAREPFVGHIEGPIDVYPAFTLNGVGSGLVNPTLDIISFEAQPTFPPKRAAMLLDQPITMSAGGAANMMFKVTGRARISIITFLQAGATVTANAYRVGSISGVGAYLILVDSKIITTSNFVEFSTPALNSSNVAPGVSIIDYINVTYTSGGNATVDYLNIQAWD